MKKLLLIPLLFVLGCGAKAHHVAVVADATFAQAVFAVDDAEFTACQTHVAPFTVEFCATANPKIKQALLDVKAVTAALQLAPTGGLPKDFPSLIKNLTDVQAMLVPLSPNPIKDDISSKIQKALAQAVAVLTAFAEVK